ncbi:MAG: bifunctional 2-C-methyl-D-erythritol 4-phosphate cytidylyltransferase/2-C-methyl-D-erythritol 2,4-cyclodiphosphate synthase [Alphaproteobacteria bacterium]|nr:bifunctional 2-C-methyl-D-erythritol 4-phosphate cytidylyltransferase/2-C-methyl-D-erythritol 2,4-cyclodiphosphate synthase [Alphaproteobacteria bacterium]
MARVAVLIVAAGKGVRAGGGVPKQYAPVLGQPMLRRSILAFANLADTIVQVVIGDGQADRFAAAVRCLDVLPPVVGGAERQDSVRCGLEALESRAPEFVLIHDAARPLVSAAVIAGVVDALEKGAEAAVPLLPVADTLRKREGVRWITVPRAGLLRAQTPQGFRFSSILRAHRAHAGQNATDDMALAEIAGIAVVAVAGEETNIKVTNAEDFAVAEALLSARAGETRIGSGYDVHRFVAGDHVWLCGLKIPHDHALEGHSDADAGLHALTDAILGAIGEGDIGLHFPPTDERWRGAPSWKFLKHAADLLRAKGGKLTNCDVTIVCERPKVSPHRDAMRARIAEILEIDAARVSVKATTTEGMGFTGRREGLAAEAVVTVRVP